MTTTQRRARAKPRLAVPSIPTHRFELDNGVTLLVSPRPGAPVCAVQAHLRGGHSLDPPGKQGTAYLTGRFVDQGTTDFTEEALAEVLEPSAGSISGSSTGITGQIAGDHWKVLLEVLASCLTAPTYPRQKIERQRTRILDRLLVERDDPRVQGAWMFRRLVYGDHWLGSPDYGTLESVAQIKRADLLRHHARNWCGKRLLVSFCGDVDPEQVRRLLARRLSGLPAGKALGPVDLRFPKRAPRVDAFPAKRQQLHLYLGHLGIQRRHPDYAALVVMDHVLGTGPGFTSRITRHLRDEQGLAYSVHAAISSSAGVLPGTFTAYIGTGPENLEAALAGFMRELHEIRNKLVSKSELELAVSYLTGSFPLGFERASRRVQSMVMAHRMGLPEDHLQQLVESYTRVTREDVRRVAREHLHPEAACLVGAGPVTKRALRGLAS